MSAVGVLDAKNTLPRLIDEIAAGGEVTITRRGHPIARLVPADPAQDPARAQRAAAGLRAASVGLRLDGITPRELIAAGRR